jgi:hypothetical protein
MSYCKVPRDQFLNLNKLDFLFNNLQIHKVPAWVAGGAVRAVLSNEKINDFDLYSSNPSDLENKVAGSTIGKKIVEDKSKSISFYRTDASIYENKLLQVIKVAYDDPIKTIESFDFRVCQAAYDGEYLYFHHMFFVDLAAKQLIYVEDSIHNQYSPISPFFRVMKYIKKGYSIPNEESLKVIKALRAIDIDWDDYDQNPYTNVPPAKPNVFDYGS